MTYLPAASAKASGFERTRSLALAAGINSLLPHFSAILKKDKSKTGIRCSISSEGRKEAARDGGNTGDVLRRIGRLAGLQGVLSLTDAQVAGALRRRARRAGVRGADGASRADGPRRLPPAAA